MPGHRKYPKEFEDAAVAMVRQLRRTQPTGAIAAVARQLQLHLSTLQNWVERAGPDTPDPEPDPDEQSPPVGLLPAGLLWCRACQQPMYTTTRPDGTLAYTCPPGTCRRPRPLDARTVADQIGRAILRAAPRTVPRRFGAPPTVSAAAAHALALLHRVTAGYHHADLTLAWQPNPAGPVAVDPQAPLPDRLAHVRRLVHAADLATAYTVLRDQVAGIDVETSSADIVLADVAVTFAELLIRLGQPDTAIRWAGYAHRSYQHLHGEASDSTIIAAQLLATAHRHAGHLDLAQTIYRSLVAKLTLLDGPASRRTLAATANLAVVLHAKGHHDQARRLLAETAAAHRHAYPGHPATIEILTRLEAMQRDCDDLDGPTKRSSLCRQPRRPSEPRPTPPGPPSAGTTKDAAAAT